MLNAQPSPRQRRVLIVEDNAFMARGLTLLLQGAGLSVECAADCVTAEKYALTQPFDVILCDVVLPDGDGWNLLKRIGRTKAIPGVALTGFGEEGAARSEAAGYAAHLRKPIDPDLLIMALREVMRRR